MPSKNTRDPNCDRFALAKVDVARSPWVAIQKEGKNVKRNPLKTFRAPSRKNTHSANLTTFISNAKMKDMRKLEEKINFLF
jgi:hypothetical protein